MSNHPVNDLRLAVALAPSGSMVRGLGSARLREAAQGASALHLEVWVTS